MTFALNIVSFFCKVIVGYKNEKGVIQELKIIFELKIDNSKNISRTFSGVVVDSVGSVHFQIVPSSGLYLSIGPFLCSQC